jgi:hypothetical protein
MKLGPPARPVEVVQHCLTSPTIHANSLKSDSLVQPCQRSPTLELANFLEFDNLGRQNPTKPTIGESIRPSGLTGLTSLTLSNNQVDQLITWSDWCKFSWEPNSLY